MTASETPRVGRGKLAVLLATYNGARFLEDQLKSILNQDWPLIEVWASDDGSTDETPDILRRWAAKWRKGRFTILNGPGRGAHANFRSLLCNPEIQAEYVAFSDQDDIWVSQKTSVAAARLRQCGALPAVFGTRTIIVDASDREIGLSPLFRRPPHLRNALVQNICGGNTMVMNREAFDLLRRAALRADFVSHDWFAYLVVTAAGGTMIYDPTPLVRYRQHDENVVGSNAGWLARVLRLRMLLRNRFRIWNDRNLRALAASPELWTGEALETIARFADAREGNLFSRLRGLRRAGVYRQSLAGQITLYLACLLRKV